jgi:hypothetical protein
MLYRFAIVLVMMSSTAFAAEDVPAFLMRQGSGTSLNPTAAPAPMLMFEQSGWMTMLHGSAFVTGAIGTGDRSSDEVFATNWVMGSAQRPLFGGHLMLRSMLSLEPATIGSDGYPEPFQTGEGLVDRQHPHDFFMELAAEWATDIDGTIGYVYAAPVGDPALGPVAFPHRASAAEIPQATLGHHLEDSTHIASSVVTLGAKRGAFGLGFSGFHGREPDDNRWDIDGGNIDSWSLRGTWEPSANISAQISTGHLNHPEADDPANVQRTTASIAHSTGAISSSAIVGWNHESSHDDLGLTLESNYLFNKSNYVTGRFEIIHRETNVVALTGGYTKDLYRSSFLLGGAGGNITFAHGDGDRAATVYLFARIRLQPPPMSHDHHMHSMP